MALNIGRVGSLWNPQIAVLVLVLVDWRGCACSRPVRYQFLDLKMMRNLVVTVWCRTNAWVGYTVHVMNEIRITALPAPASCFSGEYLFWYWTVQ